MQVTVSGLYSQELYIKYVDSKIKLAQAGPNCTWDRKVSYARDYMLEIERSDENESLVLAVLVMVHIDRSQYYSLGQDYAAARNELEIAIELAGMSRNTEAIYSALSSYSTLEFTQGNLDSAIIAYQKALPHAVSSDDGRVASTLMKLASVWQFMPEKLDLAEVMAEWAVLASPFTLSVFDTL